MPLTLPRAAFVVASAALALLLPLSEARAAGWQEIHQTSDDVRIQVDEAGVAVVRHHLRYRIVAGRFKSFELAGIDPRAELVGTSVVLPEKGGEIAAEVAPDPKTAGSVRIAFDEPRGLGRGAYVVDVEYRLDLVAAKLLTRDGALWRLAWTAPAATQGRDGARVVFALPPAPTEPRITSSEEAATTLSTLRRTGEVDELELVRAHVPRGESVTWSVRLDPKALPRVTAPELRPPPRPVVAKVDHGPAVAIGIAVALAAIAGAFAMVLRAKLAHAAQAASAAGARSRPLLPIPGAPFAYGASVAASVAVLLWGSPSIGAALVVAAMALATHQPPARIARPRAPARWQRVADGHVLLREKAPRRRGDLLDAGTLPGLAVAVLIALAVGGLAYVLRTRVPGAIVALPLAAVALVPLFVTGTRGQLPRTAAEHAAHALAPARDALARLVDLAHVDVHCLARVGEGTSEIDEVRLACVPSDRLPGLRSIELALAPAPAGGGPLPEVLVRFDDGSAAASRVAEIAPGLPVVSGRVIEEKVLRVAPRSPTPASAARLLARLVLDLEERRAPGARGRYAGAERRRPRPAVGSPMLASPGASAAFAPA